MVYNCKLQTFRVGNGGTPLKAQGGKVRVRLLVDRNTIEAFVNDGRLYMPTKVVPAEGKPALELTAKGGPAKASVEAYTLKSAWRQ